VWECGNSDGSEGKQAECYGCPLFNDNPKDGTSNVRTWTWPWSCIKINGPGLISTF